VRALICRHASANADTKFGRYVPALMSPVQVVMAWLEEMQAMVTVWAGIRSEKPAPRAASRATLLVFTS